MQKPKKASQERNKIKKGRVKEVDEFKDFRQERDGAEYVKEKIELNIKARKDYTERQVEVLDAMVHPDNCMVILDALFGTGKSHMAVLAALTLLNKGECKKIIYVRSPVESGKKIGFQPGTTEEKTLMYNAVLFDKLSELLPFKESRHLIETKTVECIIPAYIRGRSYDDTILLCDESSCFTFEEFVLITSRLGKRSKAFFLGDDFQSDIKDSGFERFYNSFDNERSVANGVRCFKLKEESDIVRSGFMKFCMVQLGVLKFKNVRKLMKDTGDIKDERDCAGPRDFMAGEVEEGDLIERAPSEPPKKFWEKLKFW